MSKENNKLISIENINADNLVELTGWEQKQKEIVEANPFIEITDNATYEEAKKRRTALVKGRTAIEAQDKVIASKFTGIRKLLMTKAQELISLSLPHEEKQQAEVKRYEAILEEKRLEKERKEQERIDNIKAKIDEVEAHRMSVVQKLEYSDIENFKNSTWGEVDFDFEEYDVLFQQACLRVENAVNDKIADLEQKEAERVERERLERENALAKKKEQLRNARMTALSPYMAFTSGFDFTTIADIEQAEFEQLFTNAKSGFDTSEADRKAKEEKEKAEKEATFNIRKSRLEKLGVFYEHENNRFIRLKDEPFVTIPSSVVYDKDILDFENLIIDIENSIHEQEVFFKQKKRTDIRIGLLEEKGLTPVNLNSWCFKDGIGCITLTDIQIMSDEEFKSWVNIVDGSIKEYNDKIESENKANAKRQKQLSGDKKKVSEYIDSLSFREAVPELKNNEIDGFVVYLDERVDQFKKDLITELNNI